jgi:hypothetical protein
VALTGTAFTSPVIFSLWNQISLVFQHKENYMCGDLEDQDV